MKIAPEDIDLAVEVFCKHFSEIKKESNSLHRKMLTWLALPFVGLGSEFDQEIPQS